MQEVLLEVLTQFKKALQMLNKNLESELIFLDGYIELPEILH